MKSAFIIALLLYTQTTFASLQVFPTRLLVTDKNRTGELTLQHNGNTTTRYKITMVFYEMNQNGEVKKVPDPGTEKGSIASMIRYSPRSITLEPNLKQTVRLLVKPEQLPPGDYRAHVYFETADDVSEENTKTLKNGGATMKLTARVAVAVPVVFRKGAKEAQLKVTQAEIIENKDKTKSLKVSFQKNGSSFMYTDLVLNETSLKKEESPQKVTEIKGVSIYNNELTKVFPLDPKLTLNPRALTLVVKDAENETENNLIETVNVK